MKTQTFTNKFTNTSAQAGTVAAEFILVLPAFMLSALLTVELALTWTDKHLLHLAAFEAARSYITEPVENPCDAALTSTATPGNPSNTSGPTPADEQHGRDNRAKRSAAIKLAAISPSLLALGPLIGINSNDARLAEFTNRVPGGIATAVAHVLLRLPSAWALTTVSCTFEPADQSVSVAITYLRHPQMPFAGTVLWVGFILNSLNNTLKESGLDGVAAFSFDNSYLGVKMTSPLLDQAHEKVATLRQKISNVMNGAENLQLDVNQAAQALGEIPGFQEQFGDLFANANSQASNVIKDARAQSDQRLADLDANLDHITAEARTALNSAGRTLTAVIYATPSVLRLVPLRETVRLVRPTVERHDELWNNARARLIGPFNSKDENDPWRGWARGMVEYGDTLEAKDEEKKG